MIRPLCEECLSRQVAKQVVLRKISLALALLECTNLGCCSEVSEKIFPARKSMDSADMMT